MRWAAAGGLALGAALLAAAPVAAFDGFGDASAEATYDRQIRFEVALDGGPPDELELLLRTPGTDAIFVVPVEPRRTGDEATYIWNTSDDYLTPNTLVTYQWRATEGGEAILSDEATVRYEDDRPGLEWQSALLGETTVHWYGDAEARAMRFGELAAVGVEQAETLMGTELAGPVDMFIYDTRDEFFGVLGPGAREWIGAAAVSPIRTIFVWLQGGPEDYLERVVVHEITHIVFHDATDNPYHEPATWVNEGIAVWSEEGDGAGAAQYVATQAQDQGLFAFDAITAQFPIGEVGSSLSYAQGGAMIDLIVDRYGPEAIARLTTAYRDGASDAEALEAATGVVADDLYASFYSEYGVSQPAPVEPEPVAPSDVEIPEPGAVDPGGVEVPASPSAAPAPGQPIGDTPQLPAWVLVLAVVFAAVAVVALAIAVSRRGEREAAG